jgi:hypothetical protein
LFAVRLVPHVIRGGEMTQRSTAILGGLALSLVVLLACACSSSSNSSSSGASAGAAASAVSSSCQQVSAVLSDGPDPDSDPVGYAEAQILPLRQISAPSVLRGAIDQLADAYQEFFNSNGKSSNAKEAVAVASKKLNSICPGAAS